MPSIAGLKRESLKFIERYGVLVAGVLIFLYYLWVTIHVFSNSAARRGFSDYYLQFSSVVMLWGILYLGTKLFESRKRQQEEQKRSESILHEYERRKMQLELLDEVSLVLNDTVNNPLAVISLSSSSIRERFKPDSEILAYLDRIDGALRRVRDVLSDFKFYQTSKIVKSIEEIPSLRMSTQTEKVLTVDDKGEIRPG